MNTTKQLVEAVEAYIKCGDMSIGLYNAYVNLCNAFEAYEQSTEQPEAIAGEKTARDFICSDCHTQWDIIERTISYDIYGTERMMEKFASQQTAFKDQKITELTNILSDTDKRLQEIQDEEELKDKEIKELKAEVEKIDYAYRNLMRKYKKAIDKMEAQNKNVTNLQQTISQLNKMYNQAINDLTISQEEVERLRKRPIVYGIPNQQSK